jgi:uncharacterized membrane protein
MSKRSLKSNTSTEHNPDQLGLERLIFFSDAVFAIAITLLALEIRLPETDELLNNSQLSVQLAGMWQEYLAYIISFLVIGTFWMAHHRRYRYIKRYDNKLMFLNLLMLMVIAFIPFPSSVISKYPDRSATIFYALTMAIVGFLLAGIWWYASHNNRLVDPDLDVKQRQRQFIAPLLTSTVFLLSIGIAFLNADLSRLSWVLTLLTSWYANKN